MLSVSVSELCFFKSAHRNNGSHCVTALIMQHERVIKNEYLKCKHNAELSTTENIEYFSWSTTTLTPQNCYVDECSINSCIELFIITLYATAAKGGFRSPACVCGFILLPLKYTTRNHKTPRPLLENFINMLYYSLDKTTGRRCFSWEIIMFPAREERFLFFGFIGRNNQRYSQRLATKRCVGERETEKKKKRQ